MNLEAFQGEEHQPFLIEGDHTGAVLLVHGFPGSAREMRPTAELLNAMGWTTKGILLPGFGPEIETIANKAYTDWVNAVEKAFVDLRRFHHPVLIVGNSMGGALAIQTVAKHGADGLVLFSPFWKVDHFLWGLLPVLKHVVPRFKPYKLFKPDFQDPEFQKGTRNFFPNADFDDPEFQRMTLELEIPTHLFDQIRAVGAGAYQAAPDVHAPTLVIQGAQDELVKPTLTKQLLARFGGATSYVEVDAAHNPAHPDHTAWNDIVEHIQQFAQTLQP